ncbi:MAG: hypothetical protein ACRDQ4_20325 [Pseudonocardiaceae bacterium]
MNPIEPPPAAQAGRGVGRSRGNRLSVRFDGEAGPTSWWPHLVRVLEGYGDDR